MIETAFHVVMRLFSTEPGYFGVETERRRQAVRFLADGCKLLEQNRVSEADTQFSVAMTLDEDLLWFVSRTKRRKLKNLLDKSGGGMQAAKIPKQLDRIARLRRFELTKYRIACKLDSLGKFLSQPME